MKIKTKLFKIPEYTLERYFSIQISAQMLEILFFQDNPFMSSADLHIGAKKSLTKYPLMSPFRAYFQGSR